MIKYLVILFILFVPTFTQAQTVTYEDRAELSRSQSFIDRVQVSMLVTAVAVLQEASSTTDNAIRVKYAGYVIRDPDTQSTRLSKTLASVINVTVTDGIPNTTLTDDQLQSYVAIRWTAIAKALMTSFVVP